MTPIRMIIAAAIIGLSGVGTAIADPPHCPPGHAKKGQCGHDRRDDRKDEARAYEQGYRDAQRDAWRAGDRFDRDVQYVVVRDYDRYNLRPPPRGQYYAEVDGQILLVQTATQLILQALN